MNVLPEKKAEPERDAATTGKRAPVARKSTAQKRHKGNDSYMIPKSGNFVLGCDVLKVPDGLVVKMKVLWA